MQEINLSPANKIYLNNQNTKKDEKTLPVTRQPIENGDKEIKLALSALAVAGTAIAAGIAIYRHHNVSKTVEKSKKQVIKLLSDIDYNKGVASLKDGTKFTGVIEDTLKNGDKIVLEYTDGIIQKSTRTGSINLEKTFEVLEDGSHKITKVENGKVSESVIETLKANAKKSQDELKELLAKKDSLSVEEFEAQANNLTNISKKQQDELQSIINSKKEAQKLAQQAEEKAQRLAQQAKEQALQKFQAEEEAKLKEFETLLKGKNAKELDELNSSLKPERDRLIKISTANKTAKGEYCNGGIDPEYLYGEDKISYEILKKKQKMISKQKNELENKFFSTTLHKADDKAVSVADNTKYLENDEFSAFSDYYKNCSVNSRLRGEKGNFSNKQIKLMDSGFKKAPALEEDAMVYRAVLPFTDDRSFIDSIKTGEIIHDFGYMSTSTSLTTQFREFAKPAVTNDGVLMRIKLPKGTKGVLGGCNEYLLPRNSDLKVLSLDTVDGIKVATCEYVLP